MSKWIYDDYKLKKETIKKPVEKKTDYKGLAKKTFESSKIVAKKGTSILGKMAKNYYKNTGEKKPNKKRPLGFGYVLDKK